MSKKLLTLLLAAALAPVALAMSEKEIDQAAKDCEKLAAQGKTDDAIARVKAIAGDASAKSVQALLALAQRVEGAQVYRAVVTALAKMPEGDGLAELISQGKSGKREARLAIVEATAEDLTGKEALVPVFLLEKDEAFVRALLEPARLHTLKIAIDPLITILERDESGECRRPALAREARRALASMIGRDFETARDWRNYWEPRKEKWDPADPPDGGAGAGAGATATRKEPEFFGTSVASSRVIILIDISGSMADTVASGGSRDPNCKGHDFARKDNCPACNWHPKGGDVPEQSPPHNHAVPPCTCKRATVKRIDRARDEIQALINGLPEDAYVNVIAFNSAVTKWQKALTRATKEAKASACAFVKKLKEAGFTETGKALDAAFEDETVDTIYLISDGAPERSAKEKIPTEPILRATEKRNRFRKVRIMTLGWGTIDEDFMRRLAEENGGTFEHIK